MKSAIMTKIGMNAIAAVNLYHNEGFRSPNLKVFTSAAEPGGEELGTTPRYTIYFVKNKAKKGDFYTAFWPENFVDSLGNYFGNIYIEANVLNKTRQKNGRTALSDVAHEIFHSIQSGYEDIPYVVGKDSSGNAIGWSPLDGIVEGTATCYGETVEQKLLINALAKPYVLQSPGSSDYLTFMLSYNFMTNAEDNAKRYSNQDFFAYFGRRYGNNSLAYLDGLLGQLHIDIGPKGSNLSKTDWNKNHEIMLDSMDLFFRNYGVSLEDAYLDFVRQRAMEHNEESRFGRPSETVEGLATTLFEKGYFADKTIDPLNISPLTVVKDGLISQLSTVAIRIKPTQAIPAGGTGATLTVTVTSNNGVVGKTIKGFIYNNTRTNPVTLKDNNLLNNFGIYATDEIVILISNTSFEKPIDVTVTITGTNGETPPSGGGCGTRSIFTITNSTIPNLKTPAYYLTTSAWANLFSGGPYVVRTGTSGNLMFSTSFILEMDLKASAVTGPGTYTIGDSDSNVFVLVYNENLSNNIPSVSGTLNLTAFGTNDGDRMTGTFNIVVKDYGVDPVPDTGYPQYNLSASFDLPWGCSEALNSSP